MRFSDKVFVVITCATICIVLVHGQKESDKEDPAVTESEKEEKAPIDVFTFVALIDIVFTDGTKKTCTGAIIHDTAVITAAHCFSVDEYTQPELTASFVVIGTKKMYDTGYEQYLPIERVIIHPRYKGWTADLALVFTFAGMMSDKPGRIVPLATEKSDSMDSEVIVYSWGRSNDEIEVITNPTRTTTDSCEDFAESHQSTNSYKEHTGRERKNKKRKKKKQRYSTVARGRFFNPTTIKLKKSHLRESDSEGQEEYEYHQIHNENMSDFDSKANHRSWNDMTAKLNKLIGKPNVKDLTRKNQAPFESKISYYRNNWRRKMGNEQNKLMVEIFGYVHINTCKKLVEKSMPELYEIKNSNEVVCYSSENHYITEEDSGAPAMRGGRLVAVTVGGVDFDGEQAAVGMKMTCFCSWIAENLPKTDTPLQCCKNCCESKSEEIEPSFRHKHTKNKFLRERSQPQKRF